MNVTIELELNRHTRPLIGLLENAHWCKKDDVLFLLNESEKRRISNVKLRSKQEREEGPSLNY